MEGGGAEDGEGAAEDGQCAAAEGSDLGAPADPATVSLGDGGAAEGSGQRAATASEGPGQRTSLARCGVSAAAITGQGGAWAEGSTAGVAGGSGHGTAGSGSAAAGGSGHGTAGSGQGAARLASATWACPDGMDPNSSYLIKIELFGNKKKLEKTSDVSVLRRSLIVT
nr:glycine-rich cell wall structural protein 1 [Aegilops tauschii subsp. strangulata]